MMKRILGVLIISCAPVFAESKKPVIHLHETFDNKPAGVLKAEDPLKRVKQVAIINGDGKVGSDQVAHFHDSSFEDGGSMEFNVGSNGLGGLLIEFDLLNNAPNDRPDNKSVIIFGVGPWNPANSMLLSSNAKRACSVEFTQTGMGAAVVLRSGQTTMTRRSYDASIAQSIKIWVNDHDVNTLSYARPDNGAETLLDPNCFVVWVNNELVGLESGFPMQASKSTGNQTLGRVGFCSTTQNTVDFLIDNIHVEDPAGESVPLAEGKKRPTIVEEVTLDSLPGSETFKYREGENEMNLFVFKPEGWASTDKRSGFVFFFGGGWTKGTPLKSAGWARRAAEWGMVGIAPDYRTKNRFGTSPLESVADGRAAFNWVIEHADELGIDASRVVVGGSSAGGHVAMWTAIEQTPPGSNPDEAPSVKPAGIVLTSAVTDTSGHTGYTPKRFGEDALALSPIHQMDDSMPPVLMFHARDDELVSYSTAVALERKMLASGNKCALVSVPEGGHGFSSAFPEWKDKVRTKLEQFLRYLNLLPAR